MRILIVRLGALGDIIHSLPAAALLKKRIPDCHISWLVEPFGVDLLKGNPAVDRVIVFPKRKLLSPVSFCQNAFAEPTAFIKELRNSPFDAALDLQGLLKSAVLSVVSGASLRFGFKGTREGAEWLLTHGLDVGDYFGADRHVVDLNLRLAAYFADYVHSTVGSTSDIKDGIVPSASASYINDGVQFPLPVPPVETEKGIDNLIKHSSARLADNAPPLVALIPGTTWSSKIWPESKWIELSQRLLASASCRLVLVGGPPESAMNSRIEAALRDSMAGVDSRLLNLTGKTDIPGLIALFKRTAAVIGADTGPLHLAAALGTCPVIGVFGSTPWQRNGPYGAQCRCVSLSLSCQPCFKKICPLGTVACLTELPVEQVLSALPPGLL